MPHSGGGGSSSGGSYSGGSGRSSSHSSSSYSSSGYSEPAYIRGQITRYPGSKRYSYYHNNSKCYYYSDRPLIAGDFKTGSEVTLLIGIAFVIFSVIFSMMFVTYVKGGPIDTSGLDRSIIIHDNANVISGSGEEKLHEYLNKFLSKTGVIVSVVTCAENKSAQETRSDSYSTYIGMFNDESHWLIYYCGTDQSRGDNWSWNLMCGDDCVEVLDSKQEYRFTKEFHENLSSNMKFEDAVISALKSLKPKMHGEFRYRDGVNVSGKDASGEKVGFTGLILLPFPIIGLLLFIQGLRDFFKPLSDEQKAKLNSKLDDDDGVSD